MTKEPSRLAMQMAEMANECCCRSDGWTENLAERFDEILVMLVKSALEADLLKQRDSLK